MTRLVAFATVVVSLLAIADWLDPVREGRNGTYYANASWTEPRALSTVDPQLSNARLVDAWRGAPPPQFSATWAGSFLAMHDGSYVLATLSDDESSVVVDGQRVVDNSGRRTWPRGATGMVTLTRGVHAIYVQYARDEGPFHLELLWARAGQPLERMPAWALTPRRVGFWSFALSAGLKRTLAAAQWAWVATIVAWALALAWSYMLKGKAWLEREQVWSTLKWVLAASLILNVAGAWWGLPGGSWAPDELTPTLVMGGAARAFSNGWFDRYPAFHYYVLTLAFSPLLLLERLGRVDLGAVTPYALLALIGRLVSIAMGIGTLLALYACGARTFGRRAGVFAAAMFALVAPFVYYAKTTNLDVPYLFWFALSMVYYLRLLDGLALRDFIGLAVCATLAICTKDQAYGLYPLMPLAIVHRMWQANREAGDLHPLKRALLDRRLQWAALAAVIVFACVHNVAFNARGFWDHVQLVTGPASETYRDFERSLAGRIGLFRLTVDIIRMAWGWPMFLVSVAGIIVAVINPSYRRPARWIAWPAVSYYLSFINVVLYNYDRFMLPVCLVLSLFGGLALDRWVAGVRGRPWRVAAAAAVFACTLLYATLVDLVMLRDSRYTVEQWLAARVGPGELIGFVFPRQYYPRLEKFNNAEILSVPQLQESLPPYFILNADYARAEAPDSEIGQLIAGLHDGQLGYRLVFRYRQPAPWPWLPGRPRDLVGDRNERPITSVLRHVNPWYEVFKKGS